MCDVKIFAFRGEFEYFQGYIPGCQISFTLETEIKKWTKISQISVLGLDEYLKPKRQKTEETRFAQLNDDELDDLVEGAQAKSTKYATNYAVSVFNRAIYTTKNKTRLT